MKKPKTKVLFQSQIEAAMKVTRSNRSAAEYLRVSYNFYKKFAKSYFTEEGVSLFDAHMNRSGRGIRKLHNRKNGVKLDDILLGKHPNYVKDKLFTRLLKNGYIHEKCERCGFCQRRPSDLKMPLVLNHRNGDDGDHRMENLEVLCFNCYFVYIGRIAIRDIKHLEREMGAEPAPIQPQDIMDSPESFAALSTMDLLTDEEKLEIMNKLNNI